jgi:hypothetical protein
VKLKKGGSSGFMVQGRIGVKSGEVRAVAATNVLSRCCHSGV